MQFSKKDYLITIRRGVGHLKEKIKKLFEEVRVAYESAENKRRQNLWKIKKTKIKESFAPGILAPYSCLDDNFERIPITIELERPTWANLLKFNLDDYYSDYLIRIKSELEIALYRYNTFQDDTPISKTISLWMGVGFEPSFFGAKLIFSEKDEPKVSVEPIIKEIKDLDHLKFPNFYKSGLMPVAHRMYENIKSILPEDFAVEFPEWGRGPFGVAVALRGMNNILIDCYDQPDFVHSLMQFIVESKKEWSIAKAKFLKCEIGKTALYNDEVSLPIVSPFIYEEFIESYEREITHFHNGVTWWHSCGKKSSLLPMINRIGDIELFDAGLWVDDIEEEVNNFKTGSSLIVRFHPLSVFYDNKEPNVLLSKLNFVSNVCKGIPFYIRADGIQFIHSQEVDIPKIKQWLSAVMLWAKNSNKRI